MKGLMGQTELKGGANIVSVSSDEPEDQTTSAFSCSDNIRPLTSDPKTPRAVSKQPVLVDKVDFTTITPQH